MKTLLRLSYAALLLAMTGPVMASGSSSVTVTTSVAPNCTFTQTPPAIATIGNTAGIYVLGNLGYSCNFVGNANLVLNLPNGSILNNPASGGDNVLYDIFWGIPPNNPGSPVWQNWATPQSIPFAWPTAAAPNTQTSGPLEVRLVNPLTVAGTYTSVISYTLSP